MEQGPSGEVRIGRVVIDLDTAKDWLADYTNGEANRTRSNPYSFPAYDDYNPESATSNKVTDADLLAPVLLNVGIKVRSFYALQKLKDILGGLLEKEELRLPLIEIPEEHVGTLVAPLYALLDAPETAPWGIGGTKFSKILHRKRPHSLVLHDKWVRECYVGEAGPVYREKNRAWAEYMTQISLQIRSDIEKQQEQFGQLALVTPGAGQLSQIRLLDILAWRSRGHGQSEPDSLKRSNAGRERD